MKVSKQRWAKLCRTLSIEPDEGEYTQLATAYSESHRAYHTQQHLAECLDKLDWATAHGLPQSTALAEVALWYHDAVYQPRAKDNELKSAEWANRFLSQLGVDPDLCRCVHSLIMATCHGEMPTGALHQLVVDIDLSVLGSEEERFEEYESQVRQEYRWVPWFLYKKKRQEILDHFLDLPRLYQTELFYTEYEQRARSNLKRSIAELSR